VKETQAECHAEPVESSVSDSGNYVIKNPYKELQYIAEEKPAVSCD